MEYKELRNKLTREVFPALRKKGILARANHLCCSTCACYDLATKAEKENARGWVYWHRQDDSAFRECGYLHLRYVGSEMCDQQPKDAWDTLKIGLQLGYELTQAGIPYEWNGNIKKTIGVKAKEA